MKIIIPNTTDYTYGIPPGGSDGFIKTICPYINADITILGYRIQKGGNSPEIIPPSLSEQIIAHIKYPSFIPLRIKSIIIYSLLKKSAFSDSDIIYCHSPEVAYILLLRKIDKPIVFHQHGSANPVSYSKYSWARNYFFTNIFEHILHYIYRHANLVIFIDKPSINRIIGKNNIQYRIINNAIDMDRYIINSTLRVAFRKNLGIRNDEKVIGFVGRLEEVKQIDILILALSRIIAQGYNCKLLIAGDGSQKDQLVYLTRKYILEDSISFMGNLNSNSLVSFYNGIDLLILPSKTEGISMAALESLACGTPVIASHVGGNPEIITPGINGMLVTNVSQISLANSICEGLLKQWDQHQVRESILDYSSKTVGMNLTEIFFQLIAQNLKIKGP